MTLTYEHGAVNTMIRQGRSFDEIEDYINALALPSAQLGALWLLAWTEATDPETRSRLIADTLSSLAGNPAVIGPDEQRSRPREGANGVGGRPSPVARRGGCSGVG